MTGTQAHEIAATYRDRDGTVGVLARALLAAEQAVELLAPWFEDAEAVVVTLTQGMPESVRAPYFATIGPARRALDAVRGAAR